MDSYFNTSQFKQLLQNYENLRDKGICSYIDAEEFTDIADYYQMLGEPQKALEAIDMALKIFPGSALPLCFKARIILIAENNPKKAEELIEQVADKSNMEYAYTKAEIMLGDNKPQQADRYLKERMKTFGGDEEDFILDCASIFADYNEYDLAEQWLKRSTLTEDDDYKDIKARILMDRGMFDESERIINELIDRDPYSNMYWNRLASSQFLRNNIRDSITSSEYSLAINPKDEEALLNKANGLFSLGNYEEAKNYYERFLKIQPNHGGVLQEMAFLESRLGHPELAMEYIDKAEENGIDKELATVTRGYIQLENDNPEETESYFRKALIDSHSSPKVIYYIAIAIYDVGYLPVAKKLLGMLLKDASPQWKDGYAYYARCCFELDSMREYLLALKTAVMKNPDEARAILGDLYPEGTNPEDYLSMPPVPPESDENIPH